MLEHQLSQVIQQGTRLDIRNSNCPLKAYTFYKAWGGLSFCMSFTVCLAPWSPLVGLGPNCQVSGDQYREPLLSIGTNREPRRTPQILAINTKIHPSWPPNGPNNKIIRYRGTDINTDPPRWIPAIHGSWQNPNFQIAPLSDTTFCQIWPDFREISGWRSRHIG